MRDSTDQSLAIVGAAGFVGRVLLRQLQDVGIRATAIVRGPPELAIEGDFHLARAPTDALGGDGFDTVINLAYPNSGPPYGYPAQNEAIERTVNGLVRDGGRIIQVSTQAVFGLALDRPVRLGSVPTVRDHPYVEAKIAAEHAFTKEQAARGLALDIVRLGNVWGYASGAWGVPIVQRLITGRPVGISGVSGTSNTTDVANAASYLAFLVEAGRVDADVRYHHLAEFSAVPWSDWIAPLAAVLGVEPVMADRSVLQMPGSGREEIVAMLGTPRTIYQDLAGERVSGSFARSALRRLPPRVFTRAKGVDIVFAAPPMLDREEQTFLAIMSCQQEFRSAVHSDWKPVLNKEQSLERFLEWLSRN
jgi:nucleoside-diphosphate-sugar epimerase